MDRRQTLEAFANALRVAPSELTGTPLLMAGGSEKHEALTPLRLALADIEFGEVVEGEAPPWPQVARRVATLNALRPRADYTRRSLMLPSLVRDLHASLDGEHRRDALAGLVDCYLAAQVAARNLGAVDLAQVASRHIREVTAHLSGPEWDSLASWARANAIGSAARDRAYAVATTAAAKLSGELDRPRVAEVYGMLHLTAALASTTTGKLDQAKAHVAEAGEVARRPGVGSVNFACLSFCAGNVDIWRTGLAVESGEGGKAVEIARAIDPSTLPESSARRSAWYIDIGRGLAMERRNRDDAVRAFRRAEDLAPQKVRTNPWVRESVADLLARARRDAGGRELRGLAYRLGLAG